MIPINELKKRLLIEVVKLFSLISKVINLPTKLNFSFLPSSWNPVEIGIKVCLRDMFLQNIETIMKFDHSDMRISVVHMYQ